MNEKQRREDTSAKSETENDGDDDDLAEEQQNQQEQIIETGAVTPTKGKYVIHCLTIVGQIEGHYILPPQNKTTKYEHVIPQLVAIQENPEIQGLIIILNTVGGDVEAGLAIAELVSGMKKPTVSLVLGGGHSIGVPLAVSAQQSFIVPSATMTIHPVRMNGVVLGVPQTLSYFDKMQERIVRFVEDNSNVSAGKFRELMMNTGELVMDVGTVLDGQQAVDAGLIDHLGGLSDAISCLYNMIEEKLSVEEDEESDEPENNESNPKEDDGNCKYMDFSPLPASPRAIAQLTQNARHKRVKPVPAARKSRCATAADAYRTVLSKQAACPDRNRHKKLFRAHRINGNGGDICDVNPFGHASPYAE